MITRKATTNDIPALLQLGEAFFNASIYSTIENLNLDQIAADALLRQLIDKGVIFVTEYEDQIIGGIAGLIINFWFDPTKKVAQEIAWWVNENKRCAGLTLLSRFEHWAKEQGADFIVMSDIFLKEPMKSLETIFNYYGFKMTERAYIKKLGRENGSGGGEMARIAGRRAGGCIANRRFAPTSCGDRFVESFPPSPALRAPSPASGRGEFVRKSARAG